ncbi:hypothetical protein ABT011_35980, partial [Streptomyces virginiae]
MTRRTVQTTSYSKVPLHKRASLALPDQAKGCCGSLCSGHSSCMGGVLRAESVWVETFTGLRMDRFVKLV